MKKRFGLLLCAALCLSACGQGNEAAGEKTELTGTPVPSVSGNENISQEPSATLTEAPGKTPTLTEAPGDSPAATTAPTPTEAPADTTGNGEEEMTTKYPKSGDVNKIAYGSFSLVAHRATIEKVTYTAKDYSRDGGEYEKVAYVYLPYGYDPEDTETKYDILYLLHGGNDNEKWYFGDENSENDLKRLLDSMIDKGTLKPCIVCTPTYQNKYCPDVMQSIKYFYKEFTNDLIPVIENQYHTYYDGEDAKESRMHRAFGGFSLGAATTWWTFENCLDEVAYYMPVSGDSWCVCQAGGKSRTKDTVKDLQEAVARQGYGAEDFFIYYGCGTTTDIAYANVTPMVNEMMTGDYIFQDGENYSYHMVKYSGHDTNTIFTTLMNGLPLFFGNGLSEEE